ncbi:MAG: hypothetical protein JWM31_3295 [Solirubrobacterales bacterium]|nr:hypothetical protein [Solirubrobacterales bacterium]
MRRAAALGVGSAAVLLAGGVAGCTTTAEQSAKVAAEGSHLIRARANLRIAKDNPAVRVRRAAVIATSAGTAAAVELRAARRTRAEADLPLLIDVRDAAGRSVYRNDAAGLQPSLQRVGLVRPGRSTWWVSDQVAATGTPKRIAVRVGTGRAVATAPRVGLSKVHFARDAGGRYLTGIVRNHAGAPLREVPIFAVALRGRRIVAAGRALVPKLPARPGPKPVRFRLYFVGPTAGARVELSVAPSLPVKEKTP